MYCLHCGDCCLRMSPLSFPEPCPNLIIDGLYHLCKDYENRPQQCMDHRFEARFCPIGMSILKFNNPTSIQVHLENGYQKIRHLEDAHGGSNR